MVLAPVLTEVCLHNNIGEKKPPRSKLRGGDPFRTRLLRLIEEVPTVSLDFCAKSRPVQPRFARQPSEMRRLLTQRKEDQRRYIQSVQYSIQEFARKEYRGLDSKERTVGLLLAAYGQGGLSEAEAGQFADAAEQEYIDKTFIKVEDPRRRDLKQDLQQRAAKYLSWEPLASLVKHIPLEALFDVFAASDDWGTVVDLLLKSAPGLATCGNLLRHCQRELLNLRAYIQELGAIQKVLAQLKTLETKRGHQTTALSE